MTKTQVASFLVLGSLLTVGACALPADPDVETGETESEAKVLPQVTVVDVGAGGGTVVSSDGSLDCGSVCTAGFKPGTTVTLNASPRYDSRFLGWQGAGCSGTGPCSFRVTTGETVQASFALQPVLRIDKAGDGTGSVFVPPDLGCSDAALWCSQIRTNGETVTLTATAGTGSTFAGWGGACSGTSSTCTLTLTADTNVTATFAKSVAPAPGFVCSSVSSMVTDTGGGVYTNWIGAWSDVTANFGGDETLDELGVLLPYDEPNTPTIESQYYYQRATASSPTILAIGPNNGGYIPEQILSLQTDAGPLTVYMPAVSPNDCVRTRFYVGADGSTYHSRADHDYTYSPAKENIFTESCFGHGVVGPDLTPQQAMVPQHLARAAQH